MLISVITCVIVVCSPWLDNSPLYINCFHLSDDGHWVLPILSSGPTPSFLLGLPRRGLLDLTAATACQPGRHCRTVSHTNFTFPQHWGVGVPVSILTNTRRCDFLIITNLSGCEVVAQCGSDLCFSNYGNDGAFDPACGVL